MLVWLWLFGGSGWWFSAGAGMGYWHSWLFQFLNVPVPGFLVLCYVSPSREAAIALEAFLCSHLSCFFVFHEFYFLHFLGQ